MQIFFILRAFHFHDTVFETWSFHLVKSPTFFFGSLKALGVISKKPFPNPRLWRFMLMFFLFYILAPTFRSLIHSELVFVYGMKRSNFLFFCMWLLSCYNLLKSSRLLKDFFLLNCWKSTDYKRMGLFLELSVVLHWFLGLSLMPVWHCFDYCCYLEKGSFELESCWVFQDHFGSSVPLAFPYEFRVTLSACVCTTPIKAARSLIRITFRSIFGKSCHLDNRPSSPWTWNVFPVIHGFSFLSGGFIGTFNKLINYFYFLMLLQIELFCFWIIVC